MSRDQVNIPRSRFDLGLGFICILLSLEFEHTWHLAFVLIIKKKFSKKFYSPRLYSTSVSIHTEPRPRISFNALRFVRFPVRELVLAAAVVDGAAARARLQPRRRPAHRTALFTAHIITAFAAAAATVACPILLLLLLLLLLLPALFPAGAAAAAASFALLLRRSAASRL